MIDESKSFKDQINLLKKMIFYMSIGACNIMMMMIMMMMMMMMMMIKN